MSPPGGAVDYEYILVGGGLANGLIALALLDARPDVRLAIVERGPRLGGEHTWCFHPGDLPPAARRFVDPIVAHRWPGYELRFPGRTVEAATTYSAVTSERFASVLGDALARSPSARLVLGRGAARVEAHRVVVDDGEELRAEVVLDGRGPEPGRFAGRAGFQKFLGLELELMREHGLSLPTLMDATVEQRGGFRFMYTLPLGPRRLLIEDTTFAHAPGLDEPGLREAILAYADRAGLGAGRVVREERGVLPMPWAGLPDEPSASPMATGYRGGWFHPATGYSFPIALRLALHVAGRPASRLFDGHLAALHREHRRQVDFCEKLNRLLFNFFPDEEMWNVFDWFYRLPVEVVARFYALDLTMLDRARILVGRPPSGMSVGAAVARRFFS